jgi:hypothetical protein
MMMKSIIVSLLVGILNPIISFGQNQDIPNELKERYYSSHIKVGDVNKSLYDSLKLANTMHPSKFYEICGSFIQDSMMNEAAVTFFLGRNRFRLYNKTNPKYEASGDGALAGSFANMFGELLNEYLNQNIDNFSELAKKSGEWYRDNKHYYFKNSENDSLYQLQTNALLDFAVELKSNPMEYINKLEVERNEIEVAKRQFNEDSSVPNEKSEDLNYEEEIESDHRPTSEIPEAFFTNYNVDHFILYKENEISAVAHGYYDTYIESSDAEISQNQVNPLHYKIIPFKEGVCVLKLYGVSEKGRKVKLAVYTINVVKK